MAKETKTIEEAEAQARKEVEELVYNSRKRETIKGQFRPAGGWMHGPAQWEFFKLGWERLLRVAHLRGETLNVTHVRAARVKGTKKIYIWPVLPGDPEAIPVTGPKGSRFVNLIDLLGPEYLMIETGYKERFALEIVESTALGPVVMLDMANSLERRANKRRGKGDKKKSEADSPEAAKPAPAAAPAKPAPEPAKPAPAVVEAAAAAQPDKETK